MSRGQIWGMVGAIALVIGLLASVGPAAQSVRDGFEFLWPAGVVGLLVVFCLLLLLDRWKIKRASPPLPAAAHGSNAESGSAPADSASRRERREAAYAAILSTSEAYINAHREVDALAYPGVYTPDLENAEAACNAANQAFVTARQRVEQHGVKPVLDAVINIEDAVNRRDYDQAAEARHTRLVPAVREDMDRPTAAFF